MAKEVIKNASITINGVNLSDHASSVEITTEFDDVDITSMGAVNKEHAKGMGDGTITVNFFQDYAAASVDATLWPISQSSAGVVVVVKKDAGAVSLTNPSWTMTGLLMSYTPLSASVGDANETECEFVNSSQTGIVRATA